MITENYELKLSLKVMSENYPRKLSPSISMTQIYRDTGVSKKTFYASNAIFIKSLT